MARRPPRAGSGPLSVGLPGWAFVPAALAAALLVLPLAALLARADWSRVPAALASPAAQDALWLSLKVGLVATALCLFVGTPLAIVLARSHSWTARILRTLVTVPLVLPPMVGGIALLYLLGIKGVVGQYLYLWFGIRIGFTTIAVVIAETFVALPFLVLTLEGALRNLGTRYEVVAATLGARRSTVLWRITLPLLGPPLSGATALCFARAMGEFGATALFAGNSQGKTRTMPLAIYTEFNAGGDGTDVAVAMALLLLVVTLVILLVLRPRGTHRAAT